MRAFIAFLCILLLVAPSQGQAPAKDQESVIRTTTQEVLLDMIVRDKKEKLILDLRPEDIEVYEDGVKQQVKTFRLVGGAEAKQAPKQPAIENAITVGAGAPRRLNPLRDINLVSIIFTQMSPRSRLFARDAALEFLKKDLRENTFIGVFSLDYRLNAIQAFTNNRARLTKAVEHAATGAYSQFAKDSQNILTQMQTLITGGQNGISVQTTTDPGQDPGQATQPAEIGATEGAALMAGILSKQNLMTTYGSGMRNLDSLLAFVREHQRLPGRKTVLFLSEGLQVPPNRQDYFRLVIGEANRANVSFYPLDVTGLTAQSSMQAARSGLRNSARISASQSTVDSAGADAIFLAGNQDDYVQTSLVGNTQLSMAELADTTGGFLIANTNDLKKPLERVMEDVLTHYEVSYVPTSQKLDASFRKITIKLARKDVQIHARNGYFALPSLNGERLLPFETAALGALNLRPLPSAFSFQAAALRFRQDEAGQQFVMHVEVPIGNLSLHADAPGKPHHVHASFMTLVKDDQGQVVEKISRDLPAEIPPDKVEAMRRANLSFRQPFTLKPGRYTLETVVLDREGQKASAKRAVLVVGAKSGLGISQLVLVRRLEPLQGAPGADDPLEFAGGKVTPALANSASLSAGEPMVYFVVYPPTGAAGKPELILQFLKDGKEVGRATPDIRSADGIAIPYLAALKLPAGQYEVVATVKHAGEVAQSTLPLTLEP